MPAASTKVTGKLAIVTGIKELDAKLRTLPEVLQRKLVKGALKNGGKRLQIEAQKIIRTEAKDTGALEKSVGAPKMLKRSRERVGVAVMPTREKLFAANKKKGRETTDYYAAYVEFGTEHMQAVRPFRRALYDNEKTYRAYFESDLRKFINEQKVTHVKAPRSR